MHFAPIVSAVERFHSEISSFPEDNTADWRAQIANRKCNLEERIISLSQLYVINVQLLCDIDYLSVVINQNHTAWAHRCKECVHVIAVQEMIKLMIRANCRQSILSYANPQIKTWLHLKMLIDVETPLIDPLCNLGYVDVNDFVIDFSVIPIYLPHVPKIYAPYAATSSNISCLKLIA